MSKLKTLLLAGAMIPALALTSFQPSFAQAPDQDRPAKRKDAAGHERGAREPGAGDAGADRRAQKRQDKEDRAGHNAAADAAPGGADDAKGQRGMRKKDRDDRAGHNTPAADAAPGGTDDANPQRGMRKKDREDRAGHNAPAADAAPGGTDDANPQRGMRKKDREDRAGHNAPAADAAPAGADDAASQRGMRKKDRDDSGPRNGMRDDNGPGDRGPDRGPRMGNNPDRGPGDRGPGDRGDRGPGDRGLGDRGPGDRGPGPGFAGGFMAPTGARRIDDIRRDRREVVEDGRTFIREPGRTIIEDGDRRFLVHDPNDRFRDLGYRIDRQRRGNAFIDTVALAGGVAILTYTTSDGRLLRRVRRGADGREVVLFENGFEGRLRPVQEDVVVLPPPPLRIPRDRYIVDYAGADEGTIYDTLVAPPLAPPPQRYTLDQVLYSPDVRGYVRSVDINTINFDTGSWIVPGDQTGKLRALAQAVNKAVDRNPNSVFLIEGYTDAVGNPTDNLSLSDRRAQSVAAILTKDFNVPPENLTPRATGDQNPKEQTSGPSAVNRRVVVRNITQLLAGGGAPPQQ